MATFKVTLLLGGLPYWATPQACDWNTLLHLEGEGEGVRVLACEQVNPCEQINSEAVPLSASPPVVIVLASGGIVQDAWAAAGKARVFVFDEDTVTDFGSGDEDDIEAFRDRVHEARRAILDGGGKLSNWALRLDREAEEALRQLREEAEAKSEPESESAPPSPSLFDLAEIVVRRSRELSAMAEALSIRVGENMADDDSGGDNYLRNGG